MLIHYKEIKPSDPLCRFVKCFWTLEKNYTGIFSNETIYPDGCLDLVFTQTDNKLSTLFIGQQLERLQLHYKGNVKSVGIRFFPFGAYPVFAIPVNEMTSSVLDPSLIAGAIFNDLADIIFSLPINEAIAVLEKFVLKRLLQSHVDISQVRSAAELLYLENGNIRIGQLADKVNLSPRTLERRFENITGLSPKSLAKIFRFNKVRNELMLNPSRSLTSICYQYNYFDQSHFIKDFKQIATFTPTEFANEVRLQNTYFYKK